MGGLLPLNHRDDSERQQKVSLELADETESVITEVENTQGLLKEQDAILHRSDSGYCWTNSDRIVACQIEDILVRRS
jgi:hypothetical protein